uniref:HDC19541 n=1 Tax=Drosophila melanogaster TaxID=7227 RepID=Q6II71_DROME|nr:TPA_inf: HDC19541 [Drosophila melanogaster]
MFVLCACNFHHFFPSNYHQTEAAVAPGNGSGHTWLPHIASFENTLWLQRCHFNFVQYVCYRNAFRDADTESFRFIPTILLTLPTLLLPFACGYLLDKLVYDVQQRKCGQDIEEAMDKDSASESASESESESEWGSVLVMVMVVPPPSPPLFRTKEIGLPEMRLCNAHDGRGGTPSPYSSPMRIPIPIPIPIPTAILILILIPIPIPIPGLILVLVVVPMPTPSPTKLVERIKT